MHFIIPVSVCIAASAAGAQTWPQTPGDMRHIMISLDSGTNTLTAMVDGGTAPQELYTYAESYTPPADVLDGMFYNAQFGFLGDGFIDPGPGNFLYLELLSGTTGLEVYEGGMRMMKASHTYAPIFGTAGSDTAWQWDATMQHHWFAADVLGSYQADFRVFVGDGAGQEDPAFIADTFTLHFNAVPAPGVLAPLALLAVRRRR